MRIRKAVSQLSRENYKLLAREILAEAFVRFPVLGSGLIDQIQKMTMAAMAIADMKVWAQRSYRV